MTTREHAATPLPDHRLEHHQPPSTQAFAWRVDAFYLAFKGTVAESVRAELMRTLEWAEGAESEAPIDIAAAHDAGELRGALSPHSRDGWWLINSGLLRVIVDTSAKVKGWAVTVEPTALLLMLEGPRAALELARQAARAVLENVEEERVRRLDLCADVVGLQLAKLDPRAAVSHWRTKVVDISTVKRFWRTGKRTGFVFGSGDAVCRIYDKTEHLRLGLDDAKRDEEYSTWRMAGWNGVDDVARAEYQFRGRLLDELEARDPEKVLEKLDALWSYATRKWLRFVELGTATRKERCTTAPAWRVVQDVVFRERVPAPPERVRIPTKPHARRAVSAMTNYCASAGALTGLLPRTPEQARAVIANWSNDRAEAWVQETLFDMAKPTVLAAKADLIAAFDEPRDAAFHLMTKRAAAFAKWETRRAFLGFLEELPQTRAA